MSSRTALPGKSLTPLSELLKSEKMVKVFVGPNKKEWVLNEDLICDRSEYFKKALGGGFIEATTKEICFEEESPVAFGLLVEWIHGGDLKCNSNHRNEELEWEHLEKWYLLWVLADKFGLENLKEKAAEQYETCHGPWLPDSEEVQYILGNTPADCPMREYVKDVIMEAYLNRSCIDTTGLVGTILSHADLAREFLGTLRPHISLSKNECHITCCDIHGN